MAEQARPGLPLALRLSLAGNLLGAAALVAFPGCWPAVVPPLLLDHLLLVGASLWPRSRLLGPNLTRLPGAAADQVALTFDDGPDPEVTPAVLELLESHRAQATFFCVGERVERHPDLAAELVRRGHRVENHSHHHLARFWFLSPRQLAAELDRAGNAIGRATGCRPAYFRAPAGVRPPWLEPFLARRGLTLVSWSRRGFDTVERDPARVAARLLRRLAPGDILLLHDGDSARDGGGRPLVLETLSRVLDSLAGAGMRSVALPPSSAP